jgi:anti-anti-sigma factor
MPYFREATEWTPTVTWPDSAWVRPFGRLDVTTADDLGAAIEGAFAEAPHVVLDLRGLSFLDVRGVELIVRATVGAARNGRRLLAVRGGPAIQNALELTRAAEDIELIDVPANTLGHAPALELKAA